MAFSIKINDKQSICKHSFKNTDNTVNKKQEIQNSSNSTHHTEQPAIIIGYAI
ncbi:MAG: hypothetical protein M3M88_03180 [Thermoproteota archaeon]|nr:hypothetical protein [Thermoproteota archaeon]